MYRLFALIVAVVLAFPSEGAHRRKRTALRAHAVEDCKDSVALSPVVVHTIEVDIDTVREIRDTIPVTVPKECDVKPKPVCDNMSILGDPVASVQQMYEFVLTRNSEFPREIAEAFYEVGRRYGVRGDVALCQSIIETGWFMFSGGTAVTPDQHNYCGLGVTKLGLKGHSFQSVAEGVTAQIQHLYAYATKAPLPKGECMVDPRFKLVQRGVAPTWNGLNGRWAANKRYAASIMNIYRQMLEFSPASNN